jgi:hypothetical protein
VDKDSYLNINAPEFRSIVLLSVQRALLGEITPNMRAISVEWSEKKIHICVYVDGEIDEKARSEFDAGVVSEVIADFPYADVDEPVVDFEFIRRDAPSKLHCRGATVYARKEF